MLRRFLVTWLVVSILGYGMAMAADVHNDLASDHIHIIGEHVNNQSDTDDAVGCDHCCHGVLHLLGLNSTETFNLEADLGIVPASYSVSLVSFFPPSVLRPPIAA